MLPLAPVQLGPPCRRPILIATKYLAFRGEDTSGNLMNRRPVQSPILQLLNFHNSFFLFLHPKLLNKVVRNLFQEPRWALDFVIRRRVRPKVWIGQKELVLRAGGGDIE
jgi:hypothetical protein